MGIADMPAARNFSSLICVFGGRGYIVSSESGFSLALIGCKTETAFGLYLTDRPMSGSTRLTLSWLRVALAHFDRLLCR